jgi:hypothetical protein
MYSTYNDQFSPTVESKNAVFWDVFTAVTVIDVSFLPQLKSNMRLM